MDLYKGDLMITQTVKVLVKGSSGSGTSGSAAVTETAEHAAPLVRLLYSFHSSGTEIKQLLGPTPKPHFSKPQ
jgi:hypothetical protein